MQIGPKPLKFGETSNFIHNTMTLSIDEDGMNFIKSIGFSTEEIYQVYYVHVLPGGFSLVHTDDAHPPKERWQIPIVPNGCFWSEEKGIQRNKDPYKVEHWKKHAFWNDTDQERIHILLEYDRSPENSFQSDFTVFPNEKISELIKMVENVG